MSHSGDIEISRLIENDVIKQLDKYKSSKTSYLENITQNINKVNNLITLDNQTTAIKECLHKEEKHLIKKKSFLI